MKTTGKITPGVQVIWPACISRLHLVFGTHMGFSDRQNFRMNGGIFRLPQGPGTPFVHFGSQNKFDNSLVERKCFKMKNVSGDICFRICCFLFFLAGAKFSNSGIKKRTGSQNVLDESREEFRDNFLKSRSFNRKTVKSLSRACHVQVHKCVHE